MEWVSQCPVRSLSWWNRKKNAQLCFAAKKKKHRKPATEARAHATRGADAWKTNVRLTHEY